MIWSFIHEQTLFYSCLSDKIVKTSAEFVFLNTLKVSSMTSEFKLGGGNLVLNIVGPPFPWI